MRTARQDAMTDCGSIRRRSRRGSADASTGLERCWAMAILSHRASRGYDTGSASGWVRTWLTAEFALKPPGRWCCKAGCAWLTAERVGPADPGTSSAARWVRTWLTAGDDADGVQTACSLLCSKVGQDMAHCGVVRPLRSPRHRVQQGGSGHGSLRRNKSTTSSRRPCRCSKVGQHMAHCGHGFRGWGLAVQNVLQGGLEQGLLRAARDWLCCVSRVVHPDP